MKMFIYQTSQEEFEAIHSGNQTCYVAPTRNNKRYKVGDALILVQSHFNPQMLVKKISHTQDAMLMLSLPTSEILSLHNFAPEQEAEIKGRVFQKLQSL